jgi:putative Ca2+/H+ antiporter (TMEM165/GDT1 family)
MRHDRLTVFAGAFGSLLVMSLLSAAMGRVLPSLMPKKYTQFAAALLFLIFGLKMLREGRDMNNNEKMDEEMREAEEEIDVEEDDAAVDAAAVESAARREHHIPLRQLEEGGPHSPTHGHWPNAPSSGLKNKNRSPSPKGRSHTPNYAHSGFLKGKSNLKRTCRNILGPVLAQSFLLTFFGEWGDRSQIATIALAAAHVSSKRIPYSGEMPFISALHPQSMFLVAVGTVVGHACCTALAVVGGRWVSTKISIKRGELSSWKPDVEHQQRYLFLSHSL